MSQLIHYARWIAFLPTLALLFACTTQIRPDPREIALTTGGYAQGTKVAVLLPLSGRLAAYGQALRDGMNAARDADTADTRPELRFYDTVGAGDARSLLKKAVDQGAQYCIGPLSKSAVERLASSPEPLPLTTLALNSVETEFPPPPNLYRFALAVEDEIESLAEQARSAGFSSALVLYPKGDWGQRVRDAFAASWSARGGVVRDEVSYASGKTDHAISRLLGDPAAIDPLDTFVFMTAQEDDARLIWPRIKAASVGKLPVLATSHVYSGRFDPARDRGLVGLTFVDIPWMLPSDEQDALSRANLSARYPGAIEGATPRLYAMAIDAYHLLPRIDALKARPDAFLKGQTGRLRIDAQGSVRRDLELVRLGDEGPELARRSVDGAVALAGR